MNLRSKLQPTETIFTCRRTKKQKCQTRHRFKCKLGSNGSLTESNRKRNDQANEDHLNRQALPRAVYRALNDTPAPKLPTKITPRAQFPTKTKLEWQIAGHLAGFPARLWYEGWLYQTGQGYVIDLLFVRAYLNGGWNEACACIPDGVG